MKTSVALAALMLLSSCMRGDGDVALGTLERDRISLMATVAEIIVAQPIPEGSRIESGQLLVQFDTRLQEKLIERLEAEVDAREAFVTQLHNGPRKEEIDAARARVDVITATLEENRLQLARVEELVSRQVEAQSELDRLRATLDSNQARLRDAEAQWQLLRAGTRKEEVSQAAAQLRAAQAQLAYEREKLADLSIVATRSGTLDSLPFHVGERVGQGAEVAVILSEDAPYARVYIPQSRRAGIVSGTELTVHIDGVERSFQGRIRWISQEPAFTPYYALNSHERSRLVYLAEVQLPPEAGNLPAGLPVQVVLP